MSHQSSVCPLRKIKMFIAANLPEAIKYPFGKDTI